MPTPDATSDDGTHLPDLAAKLNHLFTTVTRPDGKRYSNEQVTAALQSAGGPTMSKGYLSELRQGKKTNPTMKHLEALADFFRIPPAYFFDTDPLDDHATAELELQAALRDSDVRALALRASELSPAALRAITAMVENARAVEGKPTRND